MLLLSLVFYLSCFSYPIKASLTNCAKSPCLNGATCKEQPDLTYGYSCICKSGWHGMNCDLQRNTINTIIEGGSGSHNKDGETTNDKLDCLNGGIFNE